MKVVLQHITKRFPNRNKKIKTEFVAVDDFDFEIPDGQLIGLLGPSGCGKSTTLNMISGLLAPTEGRIFFGDADVTDLPAEHRGIGLVFQSYALYPHMTVLQNIMFPLENLKGDQKMNKVAMEQRACEVAKLVQIDGLLDRRPNELSGGQQQRVAIARALVKQPKVLLLDEPLSNLDARLRLQTREELRRIQKSTNITTIFVTHDQEEAMSICDMIVVMKDGRLMQIGKPQDIYDDPKSLFVAKFLGTPAINVFQGSVKDKIVYIGEQAVMEVDDVNNREVYVAVRPEGFVLDEHGPFACELDRVEVMGRDVSVISTCDACESGSVRSIIPSEQKEQVKKECVHFRLKAHKTYLFDKETEERILFCEK